MRRVSALILSAALLAGCTAMGEFFPDFEPEMSGAPSAGGAGVSSAPVAPVSSIRPESLVACRGHVLVPALGMTFVPFGDQPPRQGQYLREDSLTAPYRVLPPGAAATMDNVPSRLNIDVDRSNRILNIRCG
jgi:hypothetical protein